MRKLLRENRGKAVVSSLVTILPMAAGLLLWEELPGTMNVHWSLDGAADGAGTKAFTVFGLPLLMLAAHWLCLLITAWDNRDKGQGKKAMSLLFWLIPPISLLCNGVVYATALGWEASAETLMPLALGVLFIVIGNYMPKFRRNATMGVRLPWTVRSEGNWNATHRFAGKVWVAGGAAVCLSAFLPTGRMTAVMLGVLLVVLVSTTVYSYLYYRREKRTEGFAELHDVLPAGHKWLSRGIVAVILLFVAVVMFTGNITYRLDEDSFTVRADYWTDLTVAYDHIDAVEYREDFAGGIRTNGWGSARLLMGTFKNDELGYYTRYTYGKPGAVVVLHSGESTLVLGAENDAATRTLYEGLLERIK